MAKATWNGTVLVESDDIVIVENNVYFLRSEIDDALLTDSDTHTFCPWKGTSSYYNVVVGGEVNPDAAWYYPAPKDAAKQIADRVAFWRGVEVTQ